MPRWLKVFFFILSALVLASLVLFASGNGHLFKAIRSTYLIGESGPTINDAAYFKSAEVISGKPIPLLESRELGKTVLSPKQLAYLNEWETAAFLILRKDSVVFEKYWTTYSANSKTNSFSMAKSFTSLAVGTAIQNGLLKSVEQRVSAFLPEFTEGRKAEVKIKHLLNMNSGIDFGESYGDPLGYMAKTYYGKELYEITVNKPMLHDPGKVWKYQGGNTLLLSFILEKVSGKNLASYFSENIWKKIGAKETALWNIDDNNNVRSYCCFYSNARDFSRIGSMLLDSGVVNDQPIIPLTYFNNLLRKQELYKEEGPLVDYYSYQWWQGEFENQFFYYARGIQGQYIVIVPSWDLVMVRLGHKRDPQKGVEVPKDLYGYLEIAKSFLK